MAKKAARSFSPRILLLIALVALGTSLVFTNRTKIEKVNLATTPTPQAIPSLPYIDLPSPTKTGRISLEQTLQNRISQRKFFDKSLSLKQFSQLLWSLQGVTAQWGERTSPSVKSVYPLQVYALVFKVDGLEPGIYRYVPGDLEPVHKLLVVAKGNFVQQASDAIKQSSLKNAPAVFVISGNFQKMTTAFGTPQDQNVYLEAGQASENLYLQAQTLGLGTNGITSFDNVLTYKLINEPVNERIIYIMPVGYPDSSD